MIHFESINPDNWRPGLRVAESQRQYVADPIHLLARAWACREYRSNAFIICNDENRVGMALWYDSDELHAYILCQLFIDERYQRRGFGMEAARRILESMREDGKYEKVILCYIEGNEAARAMYEKLGFHLTGERDGDEIVMEKRLL